MCVKPPKVKPTPAPIIASPDSVESRTDGLAEVRLRTRRASAAANVLTGPAGIPSTPVLG